MLQIRHAKTHDVLFEIVGDSLEGQNLTDASLDGANLADISLQYACLRNARLRRADLSGSTLKSAMIDGADLEEALLTRSDLSLATMLGASLRSVDLRHGVLRYAKLTGADLQFANLQGADLSVSDARANFFHANLTGCDLRGANLSGANLQMSDLTGADLTSANIAGAVFLGAKLTGAKMPAHAAVKNLVAMTTQRPLAAETVANRPRGDATWRAVENVDLERLPLACPECGLRVHRAEVLADGSFRCRGCYALFSPKAAEQRRLSAYRAERDAAFMDKLAGRVSKRRSWSWLSQAAVMLAATACLILAVYLASRFYRSASLPETLSQRAIYVADAFVHDSPERLNAVCSIHSQSRIAEWLKRRPSRLEAVGEDVHYKILQQFELSLNQALVLVQIEAIHRDKSESTTETVDLPLAFSRDSFESTWHWDCDATLARSPAATDGWNASASE